LFRVGKVTGRIEETQLSDDGRTVDLKFALESAESIADVRFDVRASWYSVIWDVRWGDYREAQHATYDLPAEQAGTDAAGNVIIRTEIPVPDEEGMWRVHLALQGTPDVAIQLFEGEFRLSTTTGTIAGAEGAPGTMRVCSYNIFGFEG